MLKVKFVQWDNVVLGKIMEIDDSMFKEDGNIIYEENNNFTNEYFDKVKIVCSRATTIRLEPLIYAGNSSVDRIATLQIGLSSDGLIQDKSVFNCRFDGKEQATVYIKEIEKAINILNKKFDKNRKDNDIDIKIVY